MVGEGGVVSNSLFKLILFFFIVVLLFLFSITNSVAKVEVFTAVPIYLSIHHTPSYVVHNADVSSISLTVYTSVPAICRYDTQPGTSFEDMPYFFEDMRIKHYATLNDLEPGNTYTFYVRYSTLSGVVTEEDYNITYRILPMVNDGFPRLGITMHAFMDTEEKIKQVSKYDLLVLHKFHTRPTGSVNSSQLQRIREYNPNAKLFVHVPQSYVYYPDPEWPCPTCYPGENSIIYPLLNGVVFYGDPEERWALTDSQGNTIEDLNPAWPVAVMDITSFCPPDTSTAVDLDWNSQVVNYTKNILVEPGIWDGIFWDSLYNCISWLNHYLEYPIDLDHDNVADDPSWLDAQWKDGVDDFYSKARELLGPDIFMIGNGYHDQYDYGNGLMIEIFHNKPWPQQMNRLREWGQNSVEPTLNMVVANKAVVSNDFRYARYVLGTTLLTEAYFELVDFNLGYTEYYWMDEFAVDYLSGEAVVPTVENNWHGKHYLGMPLDDAYNLSLTDTYHPNDVWRRDFENGIVLVNPNWNDGNPSLSSITVDLETNYRKILGAQDPVNDGTIVSEVTLSYLDAIVLLKQISCGDEFDTKEENYVRSSQNCNPCPIDNTSNNKSLDIIPTENDLSVESEDPNTIISKLRYRLINIINADTLDVSTNIAAVKMRHINFILSFLESYCT